MRNWAILKSFFSKFLHLCSIVSVGGPESSISFLMKASSSLAILKMLVFSDDGASTLTFNIFTPFLSVKVLHFI